MLMETKRLFLRELTEKDAAFVLKLVTQPSFIANIGDKGVTNEAQAKQHIQEKYLNQYREHGFGLYGVILKSNETLVGVSGLVSRPDFDVPDLGYAFLDEYCGCGYATEAGLSVLDYANKNLGIAAPIALTSPTNTASQNVLAKLGFKYVKQCTLNGQELPSNLYQYSPD